MTISLRQSTGWKYQVKLVFLKQIARMKRLFSRYISVGLSSAYYAHRINRKVLNLFDKFRGPPFQREIVNPSKLKFDNCSPNPRVSVIIPSYGQVDYTLRCLASIARAQSRTSLEVIVADNASGDPEIEKLRRVAGIILRENAENMGLLRSCNAAARLANGTYLLFLNNDTVLMPGAIDALVELADARSDVGLVGSKLVYPDGKLQEAGGIVWQDGSACNYGRFDDPSDPAYNYLRETDYVTGACMLIRQSLWEKLGGFDESYAPAYYEDTDLAFRVRREGYKVLYQPRSVVVHCEGITHGTDVQKGVKAYQIRNQHNFVSRWESVLKREHYPAGTRGMRARDRSLNRRIILIVDRYIPEPNRDAGSRAMFDTIKALIDIGWIVKFWAWSWTTFTKGYGQFLQDLGVEIFGGVTQAHFPTWLAQNASEIDCVLLSRAIVAADYLDHVKQLTHAKLVYYGHDIHFARMRLQAQITKNRRLIEEAAKMEETERQLWRAADLVLYLSDEEIETVRSLENGTKARAVTPYSFHKFVSRSAPPTGANVIFVAGFAHAPNVDAAIWLVENILPLVRREHNDVKLSLIGSHPTLEVRALTRRGVEVTGFVGEDELAKRYASARVAVIPLRFGAGVKLKVIEAMQSGLPIVTTPVGAQGLKDLANIVPVCEDESAIARAVLRLLADEEAWRRQAAAQLAYVRQRFSEDAMRQSVAQALETIGYSNLKSSPPRVATAARASVQWTGGYGPPGSSVT